MKRRRRLEAAVPVAFYAKRKEKGLLCLGVSWKEREKKHYCWWLEPALAGFLEKRESCSFAGGRKEEEIRIRAAGAGKM